MVTDIRARARICTDCALNMFRSALIISQPYHSQTSPVTSVHPLHGSKSSPSRLFRVILVVEFADLIVYEIRHVAKLCTGLTVDAVHMSAQGLWEKRCGSRQKRA